MGMMSEFGVYRMDGEGCWGWGREEGMRRCLLFDCLLYGGVTFRGLTTRNRGDLLLLQPPLWRTVWRGWDWGCGIFKNFKEPSDSPFPAFRRRGYGLEVDGNWV